jgi:undecaprenyl-diphosphatase
MSLLVALLLGIVQGVFMFVPVSSTSHLVLTQTWLRERGIDVPPPDAAEMVLFDLVVHLGTLVSIVVVMHAGLRLLSAGVRDEVRSGRLRTGGLRRRRHPSGRPRIAHDRGHRAARPAVPRPAGRGVRSPPMVAGALIVTGIMLWWTDRLGPGPHRVPRRSGSAPRSRSASRSSLR